MGKTQTFHHVATYRAHELGADDVDSFYSTVKEAVVGVSLEKRWLVLDVSLSGGNAVFLLIGQEPEGSTGEDVALALDHTVHSRFPRKTAAARASELH